ncbi:MAG: hypothetical protein R3B91_14505 [Planctomycetaceae bacterium]
MPFRTGEPLKLLVNCPEGKVRDAIYAEQLAQRACELSHWDSPRVLTHGRSYTLSHAEIAVDLMTRSLVLLPADDTSRELYADLRQQYASGERLRWPLRSANRNRRLNSQRRFVQLR